MSRKKRLSLIALGVVTVLLGLALSFAPYVRSKLRAQAARYGAEVEADWVLPAWGGVRLTGVRVSHPDAPGAKLYFERIFVGWGSPREVVVDGGNLELEGTPDDLLAQAERVRQKLPAAGEASGGSATQLTLHAFDVRYAGPLGKAELKNVSVLREPGKLTLRAEAGQGEHTLGKLVVADAEVVLDRSEAEPRIQAFKTRAVDIAVKSAGGEAAPGQEAASLPQPSSRSARLAAVRALFDRVASELDAHMAADASIELGGLTALVERGDDRLSVGPATVRLARKDGRFVAEYVAGASGGDASSESLSLKLPFPKAAEPLAIEVRGGPISLAALGVHDGDFRLLDVERTIFRANAKIEIDPQGEVLSFDGEGKVDGLSINVPRLANEPIRGVSASFRGGVRAALDGSKVSVKNGEVELGNVRVATTFDVSYKPASGPGSLPSVRWDGSFEVPLVPCQSLLDAAPKGLMPTVSGMRMAGSVSLKGGGKIDTETLDKSFDLKWDLASTCRVTEVPAAINVTNFKKPFKHAVYDARGERATDVETGPTTRGWVGYGSISRFMSIGAVSFEDARFHQHEGFDQEAIRNSIRENLRKWQFVRGASTLSMQLAKNLYLKRDKVLGRKLEEMFLTMYLEQALTKEQILELYLNVVEFGPNVYGVSDAAQHYFHTSAAGLTISQAFYLASILPSPRKDHFSAGGAVGGGWLKLLRTVMKHAHKRHRISDEELAAGLAEIPVRGSTSPLKDPDAEQVPDSGPEIDVRDVTDPR